MTLVIATRGIDLSVGAVVAISGAVACSFIAGAADPTSPVTVLTAVVLAVVLSFVLGSWNGFLVSVVGIQPIIATLDPDDRGPRHRDAHHRRQITTVNSPPFKWLSSGFLLGLPVAVVVAGVLFAVMTALTRRTALGLLIEAVGINPAASRLAGLRSRGIVFLVYCLSGSSPGWPG